MRYFQALALARDPLDDLLPQVRFFERVKLERRIKKVEKQIAEAKELDDEAVAALVERLACLQDDLQVCGLPQPTSSELLASHAICARGLLPENSWQISFSALHAVCGALPKGREVCVDIEGCGGASGAGGARCRTRAAEGAGAQAAGRDRDGDRGR